MKVQARKDAGSMQAEHLPLPGFNIPRNQRYLLELKGELGGI